MKTLKNLLYFLILSLVATSCKDTTESKSLTVYQINLWHGGGMVEGALDIKVSEILDLDPDIVLFCEVNNADGKGFIPALIEALKEQGKTYYGQSDTTLSVSLISKYPILEEGLVRYEDQDRSVLKAKLQLENNKIATVYSAHLDYRNYACFLPRGYSGSTWKKIDAPVTNEDSVLTANRLSFRDEAITAVIQDAKKNEDIENGIIILGGDFNEPSHLDWQADTKDLFDHNGAIINWDCSVMLHELGFKDSFREKYPNPVTHPGFTFPANNENVELDKLMWAPEADERDRIDFIYYVPNKTIELKDVVIIGPVGTVANGQRVAKDSQDIFKTPSTKWTTDHKALFATFSIK